MHFAAQGWKVWATDIDEARLATLQEEAKGELAIHQLDVRDAQAIASSLEACVQHFGGMGIAINNAAVITPGRVGKLSDADIESQIDVNLKGVLHGTNLAGRLLAKAGQGGHIINLASMAAHAPVPGLGVYSATKFGVRSFSLVASEELGEFDIAVTAICPDLVDTPMLDLQLEYPEAALTFSGPGALQTKAIVQAVEKAIRKGPREITIPRWRGWIARFANLATWAMPILRKRLEAQGVKQASRYRRTES